MSTEALLSFADRLNYALDLAAVPPKGAGRQNFVAKMFGVSQKGARRWLEAEAFPETKRLPSIAQKLNVSIEWLMYGLGSTQIGIQKSKDQNQNWKKVPLINWEQATTDFTTAYAANKESDANEIIINDKEVSEDVFAVKMKGSSMEPLFPEGTILIVDPHKQPANRNYVLVLLNNEKEVIFKQILIDGDKKYLKSLSPDFVGLQPILLRSTDKIIGSLIQARMNY